ncbi:A49-like RNA polymerase I associated factor-domain-containing protein [Lasiosphaeria hispida]|uniref:A49-like RNA polymerase I associated factor-domain-containing protein n=1 Tax=Lasiosphaeria hispida TaxID=260671 RepID=A0AAJ0MG97_9PEZI|nr:A49-like RNA polymerase I associated factor-domain-containing protein [Lasiosphaeria hispida]
MVIHLLKSIRTIVHNSRYLTPGIGHTIAMVDSSIKKRKQRLEDSSSKAKKKKVNFEQQSAGGASHSLKISKLVKPKISPPVIAVTSGISLPASIDFLAYDKTENTAATTKKRKNAPAPEMLLHSTSHRSLDYTAREDCPQGVDPLVRHFIGVFDPKSGQVQVIEAKKMVVRGAVRSQKAADDAMVERSIKQTNTDMRTDLGETFGTKKARKAIKSKVENAITSGKRADNMGSGDLAIMDSIKTATQNMATQEELQAVIDGARPVPRGHYDAEEIQDVYIPAEIIGAEVLNAIPVMDWQEKVEAQQAVEVPSRFVANRINRLAHNEGAVERLRVARYLLFVLILWATARQGKERGTKMIGKRDQLRELMAPAPEMVIENIRRKFSDNGVMRKTHVDLLITHCCVFASIIDNFEVNTFDLREDLKMEQKQLSQYFMEVGARMKQAKNGDKVDHFAKLALPLVFPKTRKIRSR